MNAEILVPLLVAIIAPIGAYFLAARRMSGKVSTSDASELWTEARNMRDDYRSRLGEAGDRTRDLETRVAHLEGQNTELVRENFRCQTKIQDLEALVTELRDKITELKETIATQAEELGET